MNFSQSFRLAIKSLLTSKLRSLLTMLGIIIGVGAVIVITSLGAGMQRMMTDSFEQLGSNLIQTMLWADGSGSRSIHPDDMYELVEKHPDLLTGVSPYLTPHGTVRKGSDEFSRTRLFGVSEFFYNPQTNMTMQGEQLAQGRYLSYVDVDRQQRVCVIGDYLNQHAFHGDALGKTISIQGQPFTVIGVLKEHADGVEGSWDDVIYMPYGCAMALSGTNMVNYYMFSSATKEDAPAAKGVIERRLQQTFQDDKVYMTMSSAEMMDAMNTMMNTMMIVLVAIAAISLLVGGIGIMNIMLVSVTERTREIGIRKSLGAKRRDIRGQFIIEAGTTSAIGGVLGILVGMLLARAAGSVIGSVMASSMGATVPFNANPTPASAIIAFTVSVGIGVLFGFLPADKAAKLNPIDALRYD